jgi:hypothetical protein
MAGKETLGEMALFEVLGGAGWAIFMGKREVFHLDLDGFWTCSPRVRVTKPFVEMEDFQKPFQ